MAPFFVKPENALKRAQELIAVNQSTTATQLLVDVLSNKRSRGVAVGVMEPLMLCLVELCVAGRKGRILKDTLYAYKSGQQKQGVATIEVVLKQYLNLARDRVKEAQARAEALVAATPTAKPSAVSKVEGIEDLEATETPESILLSTVSSEGHKDRMDREVVTPWVKFLWESYRTALDLLRNNARLELMYQSVVQQAFEFCLLYGRKTEFRRLCDLLRQHLASATKYAPSVHGISLDDPETLSRHLDIRFGQLNAAAEMELWQEAFRSIEDIFNLFSLSSLPPKSFMLANYYEKLARIFWVSENGLFHAAAWQRYYALARQYGDLPTEEIVRMSNVVLMSALATPIIHSRSPLGSSEGAEGHSKSINRLTSLCKMSAPPTRASVLRDATQHSIFMHAVPALRELYQLIEVDFSPLTFSARVNELLATLNNHKDLAKYIKPLRQVLLTRLLQQLSDVYSAIPIDTIVDKLLSAVPSFMASVVEGAPETHRSRLSAWVEKFVLQSCKDGNLHIRIDHQSKCLTFENDVFHTSAAVADVSAHRVKLSMRNLCTGLSQASSLIRKESELKAAAPVEAATTTNAFITSALANMKAEIKKRADRIQLIEQRKIERERALAAKEAKEKEARARQLRVFEETERLRMAEEARQREISRFEATKRSVELAENRKLAESLTAEQKKSLGNLDEAGTAEKLVALQIAALTKEKEELAAKVASVTKRVDYTHRAMIRAEIPLLKAAFEKDHEEAQKAHEAVHEQLKQSSRAQWEAAMAYKARFTAIRPDFNAFAGRVTAARQEAYEAAKAKAAEALALAKEDRIKEQLLIAEAEKMRRLKEEALATEQKRREEQELRERKEREAAEAAEKEAKREAELALQAERDAVAEKQRKREAEIEAKLSGSAISAAPLYKSKSPGAWVPLRKRDPNAKPSVAPLAPPTASGPTSDKPAPKKYIPPGARK